jgi:hypothetical protein
MESMLNRLNRGERWRAALLLSLIYALTILAPAIANAFAPSPVQMAHHHGLRTDVSAVESRVLHDHVGQHDHHHKHQDDSTSFSIDLQCCGLACISALPAASFDIARPSAPVSVRLLWTADQAPSRAPPQHYRPPIL